MTGRGGEQTMAGRIVTRYATLSPSRLTEAEVASAILTRSAALDPGRPHLVVTPNMNHLARLQRDPELGRAYEKSTLVLADGWPVVTLANRLGATLSGRSTGSGLLERLASSEGEGRSIFLIGGSTPTAGSEAARRFRARGWVVEGEQAPRGWLDAAANVAELRARIAEVRPDLIVIGIGSPRQEVLGARFLEVPGLASVILGVGAAIDFVAGETRRAPSWMQRAGIEWLHRMWTDPGRLVKRYAGDLLPFAQVVLQSRAAQRNVDQ